MFIGVLFGCFVYLAVIENVVFDEHTREVDYLDKSVTGKYASTCSFCSYNFQFLNVNEGLQLYTSFAVNLHAHWD